MQSQFNIYYYFGVSTVGGRDNTVNPVWKIMVKLNGDVTVQPYTPKINIYSNYGRLIPMHLPNL